VLARGGDSVEGLTLLGDVYAKQGAYGEALDRYRGARAAASGTADAIAATRRAVAGEVRVLIMLGRGGEARPLAEDLLDAAPADVEMLILAATARADGGDPAAALDALERARRGAPARADVLKQIGDVARSIGDFESAAESYRYALTLDPDFAVVRYQLATILEMKGFNIDAERELVAALDSVPTYTEATLSLASLRRRLRRHEESLRLLVELLQRDPYNLMRSRRLVKHCSRARAVPTRQSRSRACCASTRSTSAHCTSRVYSPPTIIGTAKRSIAGVGSSTSSRQASTPGVRVGTRARQPICSASSSHGGRWRNGDRRSAPRARDP
jgi:tetratricopeptide (TPR) repeat protein